MEEENPKLHTVEVMKEQAPELFATLEKILPLGFIGCDFAIGTDVTVSFEWNPKTRTITKTDEL